MTPMGDLPKTTDKVLADRLAAEIGKLLAGRTVADSVVLLANINNILTIQAEVEAESITRH